MSKRVNNLTPFILTLQSLKPKHRKILAKLATNEHLRGLQEASVNIIKNTVQLSEKDARICRRYRKPLRLLALKRYPAKNKRELIQSGGFLAALLPVLASVLGGFLAQQNG